MWECGISTANSLGYAAGNTLGTNADGRGIEGRIARAEANHAAERCGCTPQGISCPSRPMFGQDDRHIWCRANDGGKNWQECMNNYACLTTEQYYTLGVGTRDNPGEGTHWNNSLNESIIPSKYGTEMSQTEWLEKLQEMKGG